jgi:WD40 repeat protein
LRSNRRLRRSLVGVAALLVVALIAAGVAIANRSTANRRARDATTERLAFESQAIGGDDLVTSSLLAVESFRRQNSPRTRSAMLAALQAAPERSRYFGQAAPTGFGEVAITGDGHTLANVHFDGLEFYELPSGHLARERPIALTGGVGYYAVNADARSAVIGNAAGDSIELWDVVAHRRLAKLRLVGSNGTLEDVAISADGRRIALATSNKGSTPRLEILDDKLHVIAGPVSLGPSGAAVKFCPDGSLVTATIAASVHKIAVTFRRADTLQPLHRAGTMPGLGFGAAHCAHGRAVFAAFGGAVAVFDAQTGQRIGGLFGSGADAGGVMPDGSIVLVLDQNGNLQRYDINSGQAVGPTIATGLVRADLVIAPDGGRAYVGSSRIAEVALDGTAPLGTLIPGTAGAIRTSLSGDQSVAAVVAGTPENPITRFVDVHSGRILHTVAGDARYLPDGHSTFTFRTDGVASVGTPDAPASRWKAQVAHRITGETQNFFVSADGSVLAVRPDDDTLHVYDLATGRLRFAIDDPNYGFRAMTLSPTGDLVGVRRDIPSQFELLNARTGKRVGAPIGAQLGGTPFFSSDGKSLLIATRDGPIVVVDIKTRRTRPITLAGHTTNVADIVSLGDGRTIASADAGGTVRLWDLSTGVELGRPIPITYPLITPDAHWADGALYPTDRGLLIPTPAGVLDADIRPQTLLDRVCSRPGENLTPQAFTQHLPGERYHLTCSQYPPPPSG